VDAGQQLEARIVTHHIDDIGERRPEAHPHLGQPDSVNVRTDEVFVGEIETGWRHAACDHAFLTAEEELVVR
jgi:hypothetical protein